MDIAFLWIDIDNVFSMHRYTRTNRNDIISCRNQQYVRMTLTVSIFVIDTSCSLVSIVFDFVTEHFVNVIHRKS
jgi:hypothetical protein